MKVGINGFGRIGRSVFKIAHDKKVDIAAVNDVHGAENSAYLLKYDSIYGRYKEKVAVIGKDLVVNGKRIKILTERDPNRLPWKEMGVDVVIEATGIFRDKIGAMAHIQAGAKYSIITAPAEAPDITIVPGVNHEKLKKEYKVISVASCTTNCMVPMIKVLHDAFGIQQGFMTTIHGYTNDQNLHDGSHKKLRRGRAAALNMVPTTTGAAESVVAVMPELLGKIDGFAVRVPIAVGSLVDLVVVLKKKFDEKSINAVFKKAASGKMKGIIEYSEDELVSSDVIGNSHSCVFDALSTQKTGNLVKVLGWYDNEFGYSNRVVDVVSMLKKWC
ncbi:type I glyceraldehyde-3-phosphate dehydrogenase [Candidatus Pacearchaeota archaeon]|nr:type I glyceraldehyde-3-phosphate dehydrogenase [Candidatus Pacearchaeota archaeon]